VLDVVAPAMDLESFLAASDYRDRKIVAMKAEGHEQIAIAAELGVSPSAVCLRLRAMRQRWDAMGVA
jgi:transposase